MLDGELFIFEVLFIPQEAGAKISSMSTFVLTLAHCITKIREDFQVFDTAAQTMTDGRF